MNAPKNTGFALVLVLWALVLLTTIGVSFGYAVRVETASGTALADQVRAEAVATAGIRRAILGLIAEDRNQRWNADGTEYEIIWPEAKLRVRLQAESGKVDLNFAPRLLLVGLFGNLFPESDADALADAVLDWRDRDDRVSDNGAEEAEYAAAGRWGPANARFGSVAELSQVIGFDSGMVEQAVPVLTVYGRQPRINALAAEIDVLTAIPNVTIASAQQFIAEREEALLTDGKPDSSTLGAGARYVDMRDTAHIVAIRATAELDGGASTVVEAVVNTRAGDQAYETLDWRIPIPAPTQDPEMDDEA